MSTKLLTSAFLILLASGVTLNAAAKDDAAMTPPKPVNNKVLESMVGTWVGESDMMGTKMQDTMKISWTLNHQFLMVELHSKNLQNPAMQYEGMGMFGVEGNASRSWWFDSWGAPAVSTGKGSFRDNTLEIADSNKSFKEVRSFTINGNELKMMAKGTMTMNGKETPFDQTVTYKKQ